MNSIKTNLILFLVWFRSHRLQCHWHVFDNLNGSEKLRIFKICLVKTIIFNDTISIGPMVQTDKMPGENLVIQSYYHEFFKFVYWVESMNGSENNTTTRLQVVSTDLDHSEDRLCFYRVLPFLSEMFHFPKLIYDFLRGIELKWFHIEIQNRLV